MLRKLFLFLLAVSSPLLGQAQGPPGYNTEIIDVIRSLPKFGTTGGLQKRVALWPCNAFNFGGGEDRRVLAEKLGFLSINFGWFRAPPGTGAYRVSREFVQICKETGAHLWIRVSPYADSDPVLDLYRYCDENNLKSFTYSESGQASRQLWFRCGDPRPWLKIHDDWLEHARLEGEAMKAALAGSGVQVHFHVDFENWEGGMETFPEPLANAIRAKAWAVAVRLREAVPDAIQEWNDKFGWRDSGLEGWHHSSMYPRPVEAMPGDVISTLMFLPGEPAHWEALAKRTLETPGRPNLPWVWTLALGVTGRASTNWSYPGPVGDYVWGPQYAAAYHPDRSWLLGLKLSGRQGYHPRWAWTRQVSWLNFEFSLLEPESKALIESAGPWTIKQHWQALVDGMLGRSMRG